MAVERKDQELVMLGTRIKAVRRANGYPKAVDFQKKLGDVGLPLYYQWEMGRRRPSAEALKKISKIANVNYEWLATGKGSPFDGITIQVTKEMEKQAMISYEILTGKMAADQKPISSKIKNAIISYADKEGKESQKERELVYIHIREELMTKILTQLLAEFKKLGKEPEPAKLAKFSSQIYADIVSTEPNTHLQPRLVKTLVAAYGRLI